MLKTKQNCGDRNDSPPDAQSNADENKVDDDETQNNQNQEEIEVWSVTSQWISVFWI